MDVFDNIEEAIDYQEGLTYSCNIFIEQGSPTIGSFSLLQLFALSPIIVFFSTHRASLFLPIQKN